MSKNRRKSLTVAPISSNIVDKDGGRVLPTWERYITQINDYIYDYTKVELSLSPSTVPANSTSEQTFTVQGASIGDFVSLSKPTHTQGIAIVNTRVSAVNTVVITFMNITVSPITPPTETYTIKVEKI